MESHYVTFHKHPIFKSDMYGFLSLYERRILFRIDIHASTGLAPIRVGIDLRNVDEIVPYRRKWIFPAFEIHTKDGSTFRFSCRHSNKIVSGLHKAVNRFNAEIIAEQALLIARLQAQLGIEPESVEPDSSEPEPTEEDSIMQ